jgi:methyltransferase
MVTRRGVALAAVGAVAVQRLAELGLSRRHERALRRDGAVEVGAGHYPAMVALHATWLVATVVEARVRPTPLPRLAPAAAVAFAGAQLLRYWAISALGQRWTTRILVPPDAPRATTGPYRWIDHPNYVAVVMEIASFPLLLGAPRTAVAGSLANAAVLAVRISAEDAALAGQLR